MFPLIAQWLIIIIVIGCLLKPGYLSGGDSLQPPEAILWISAVFFANLVKNVLIFTSCLSHTFVMRHVYVHKNINSLRRSGTCELIVCVREIQTSSETTCITTVLASVSDVLWDTSSLPGTYFFAWCHWCGVCRNEQSRSKHFSRVLKVTRVLKLQRARLGSRESKLKPLRRNETAVSRPASSNDLSWLLADVNARFSRDKVQSTLTCF